MHVLLLVPLVTVSAVLAWALLRWARSWQASDVLNGVTRICLRWRGRLGEVRRDQAYGGDARQRADVYLPPATCAPPARGWPLVVFFYGGSWQSGHRHEYGFVGHSLAARGMVVVVADYRLYPAVSFPAFVEDGAAATAWTARASCAWPIWPTIRPAPRSCGSRSTAGPSPRARR